MDRAVSPAEHRDYFVFWGIVAVGFAGYLFALAKYVRDGKK
jgi:hypothetical protein